MADDEHGQANYAAGGDDPDAADADQASPLLVPSHTPLPPPPEINYTRPASASRASLGEPPGAQSAHSGKPVGDGGAVSHGAGLAAGSTFVVSIIAGAMAGNWIDARWNHTAMPWATLIMTLIGAAAGFLNMTRIMARAGRNKDK